MNASMSITHKSLGDLMSANPALCSTGWRPSNCTDSEFSILREELAQAVEKVDLCRRLLGDERFLREHRGQFLAYNLKHIAEEWDFDSVEKQRRSSYNGYVPEGAVVAAAMLEGLEVFSKCGRIYILMPHPRARNEDNGDPSS